MKNHYDLIVAGGGFAGVGAAVAAARRGISVLLVEKNGYLPTYPASRAIIKHVIIGEDISHALILAELIDNARAACRRGLNADRGKKRLCRRNLARRLCRINGDIIILNLFDVHVNVAHGSLLLRSIRKVRNSGIEDARGE